MIQVAVVREYKPDYFMSDAEVKNLWEYSKRWSMKWQLLLSFMLWRGMRIGEVCAINLTDLSPGCDRLRVTFEKSHVQDTLPLLPEHAAMVREYVRKNAASFRDGYLFPYYSSKRKAPHLTTPCAEALFAKLRKVIGKDHPGFLECRLFPSGHKKYRISFHSLRRWHETRIHDCIHDRAKLAQLMRYLDISTVDTYLNPYETWKQEQLILGSSFSHYLHAMDEFARGQTKLSQFTYEMTNTLSTEP